MKRSILTGESLVVTAFVMFLAILFWPMQDSPTPEKDVAEASILTTVRDADL